MGDSKAKIKLRNNGTEQVMGKEGIGRRNEK